MFIKQESNRLIMRKNTTVAEIDKDDSVISFTNKAPLLIQQNAFKLWENSRETDVNRTNLRVLRRFLGIGSRDTVQALRKINYASLFDTFWLKEKNSQLAWEDIKFTSNPLFLHALCGADFSEDIPFKSPEHSNIGSFEKGWKPVGTEWYLYKQGRQEELWSEMFSTELLRLYLKDKVVKYWIDSDFIVCKNFIDQDKDECLEHYHSFGYNNVEETFVLSRFREMGYENLIPDLKTMWFADALVQNVDRHEFNFGIITSNEPIKLAPLYDWNLSMISFRYPKQYLRYEDPLIKAVNNLNISAPFIVKEKDIQHIYRNLAHQGFSIKSSEEDIIQFVLSAQDNILKN